jgi:hypothetical protein
MKINLQWCCDDFKDWVIKCCPDYIDLETRYPMSKTLVLDSVLFAEINNFKVCPFCSEEIT